MTYDYEDIVAYDVTTTEYSFYYEKEGTETYTRYVVKENGEWKLYRDFTKSDIAWCYWKIGVMYYKGTGKEQNYSQAISYYNKALEVDNTYNEPYYWLALAYDQTEIYEKAIECAEIFVQNATEDDDKSDGLNVIGVVYSHKGDKAKAKSYYKQALELDPENEYAKDNLESIE